MSQELLAYLRRPELYEKTAEKFWNDPHISRGMLEAHLDPNTDAASRKPEFIERSAEWIASLLPRGAALLDIGCGPGLYAKRFAERGLRVTGLDFSERSIAYACAQDPNSEYVLQNYLEMEFDCAFDMVTLIWCDYGALPPEDRRRLLERVRRALKPGGRFLLDAFTPVWFRGRKHSTSWQANGNGGFWSPRPHICLDAEYYYGDTVGARRTVIVEDAVVRCYNIWDTCFTPHALSAEMEPHGFICERVCADATDAPYVEDSPTLCAVMKKRVSK